MGALARFGDSETGITYQKPRTVQGQVDKGINPISALGQATLDKLRSRAGLIQNLTPDAQQRQFTQETAERVGGNFIGADSIPIIPGVLAIGSGDMAKREQAAKQEADRLITPSPVAPLTTQPSHQQPSPLATGTATTPAPDKQPAPAGNGVPVLKLAGTPQQKPLVDLQNVAMNPVSAPKTQAEYFASVRPGHSAAGLIAALNASGALANGDMRKAQFEQRNEEASVKNQLENQQQKLALAGAETSRMQALDTAKYHAGMLENDSKRLAAAGEKKDAAKPDKAVEDQLKYIRGLNLPQQFAGKDMELAQKFAAHEDPTKNYGIYYGSNQNRMGVGVRRSDMEPLLAHYKQAGYSQDQALSFAMNDLKEKKIPFEDVPNLARFAKNRNKPVDSILPE